MVKQRKTANGTDGAAWNLAAGTVASMVITLIGTAVCAALISSETIAAGNVDYCAIGVLLVSAIGGASIAAGKSNQKRLQISILTGMIYLLLLLALTALFFGSQYKGVGVTLFVVVSGCVLPVIIGLNRGSGIKKGRSKTRRR